MTRVNSSAHHTPKPHSVTVGELAISAGIVGHPITVCFTESPADVDCELWKYLARFADPGRVLHVHGQTEVRKLSKAIRHCQMIVVHADRLFEKVAWIVQSSSSDNLAPICHAGIDRLRTCHYSIFRTEI